MDTPSTVQGVADAAFDAVISIDENNRIVSFNVAAERIFGYSAREIIGHNVIRLMPERFRAGHIERARGFSQRGGAARRLAGVGSGISGLRADGREFPMDASVSLSSGAQGRVITAIIRDISDHVAMLQALRESEQRLRLAMESAGLGDAEVDIVTGALKLNNLTAAQLMGAGDDPARWVLPTFLEPIDAADRELVRGKVEAIVREDRALDAEFRVNRPDGTQRWVYGRGRLRRGPQGEAEAVIGVLMDITERRHVEDALRQSETRFRRLADNAPVLIWISGEDKLCTYFNEPWLRFTGRTLEQEVGNGWADGVHPDDLARCLDIYTKSFDAREPFLMDYRLRRFDGEYRWISDRGVPNHDAHGRFVGYIGSCTDITERKQGEEALRASEAQFRAISTASPLGIFQIDAQGHCIYTNEMWQQISGFTDQEARGQGWRQAIHPDDRERVFAAWQEAADAGLPHSSEHRYLRPDGRTVWTSVMAAAFRNAEGLIGYVGTVQDITERKQDEVRLRQLSQSVLAAQEDERRRIARELHDQIGQALTAVLLNLRMLRAGESQDTVHELQATLGDVLQQVRELSLNLRPSMLDTLGLEAALKWYLDRQRPLGRFAVHLSCPPGRLPPETETLLFRLVQEAVTNILRHARARNLWVSVETQGDTAVLTIRDDGVGFDPKSVLPRAHKGGSFGVVGMAERAQLAGGTVTFESVPEQGATVTAVLPLRS